MKSSETLRRLEPKATRVEEDEELDQDPTKAYVLGVSLSFIAAINARKFARNEEPWTCMDPKVFRATFDQEPVEELDLDEYLAALVKITSANPEHQVQVVHTSASVDEGAKTADVFLTVKTHGLLDDGLVTEGIGILKFMCWRGKWQCVRYMGMRGSLGANDVPV